MASSVTTLELLIGKWSLEVYENSQSSGASILIHEGQSGLLEYTKDGKVCLSIQRDQEKLKTQLRIATALCFRLKFFTSPRLFLLPEVEPLLQNF